MTSAEMDVGKYLSRINFSSSSVPAEPSLPLLRALHTCHLRAVPFEDLTVHSGGRVHLELPLLYHKIVVQHRGGFCCENNSLFSWLLTQLGFQVTLLSGQVRNSFTGFYGPPCDHMVLMVCVGGRRWLCDVGFGVPGFSTPLSMETNGPQVQGHRVYRIRKSEEMHFVEWRGDENRGEDGEWTEIYKFTFAPRCLEDFTEMCQYHQSSPSSIFFCKSLCTILKPYGRITYIGRRLITVIFPSEATGGMVETTTRELQDEEIPAILAEKFGIVLPSTLIPKDDTITPPAVIY
ncbi:arylamine N-acetyltransferase, liver isozyme-like [Cololabis saira]|uniref:arylamine N-acetyltransferase, liver isozyme-like n=1 Tax=Cololabis saira TaxID=129043 RepID=UPI002AD33015|nr:arylamine N-acetyltransferase, liver isozyme-like [Cololabis saira]